MQSRPGHATTVFPNAGQAVLLMLGAVILQVATMATLTVIAALYTGGAQTGADAVLNPWTLGAVNIFAVGIALNLGLRASREPAASFLALRPFAAAFLPAVALSSLGLAILMQEANSRFDELLHGVFGLTTDQTDFLKLTSHRGGAWLLFVIVAPLTEEYLFRRMILHGLLAHLRRFTAIGLSALLFGLMHLNFRQLLLGLVLGTTFGWWYARTRSVGPGLIGHALFNSVAGITMLNPGAIPALGSNLPHQAIVHQPWWVTLGGVGLAGLGFWRFKRVADAQPSPAPPPQTEETTPLPPLLPEPPVIQPAASPDS